MCSTYSQQFPTTGGPYPSRNFCSEDALESRRQKGRYREVRLAGKVTHTYSSTVGGWTNPSAKHMNVKLDHFHKRIGVKIYIYIKEMKPPPSQGTFERNRDHPKSGTPISILLLYGSHLWCPRKIPRPFSGSWRNPMAFHYKRCLVQH